MYTCMPKLKSVGFAALFALVFSPLQAQEVTLKSLDGTVSMTGDLLEFDGLTYRISMLIGEISIDASQVVCEGADCPNQVAELTEFSVAGSNSIGVNLLPTLIEVFAFERGGDMEASVNAEGTTVFTVMEADGSVFAEISVQPTDTIEGLAGLMSGAATIGMASRRATNNELAAFELSGNGSLNSPDQERIVGLDGVIAAVNDANPVEILSLNQIAAMFSGSITNWNQVGGADAPVNLYRRDGNSGTNAVFAAAAGGNFGGNATELGTDAEVSDAVANDPNGIGLTSYAQARTARALTLRSVCGQLFEPSDFSIKTEEYPLARRLYLYNGEGELPDVAREFLDFAMSPTAQSVVVNAGFVGQDLSTASLDEQGRRMAQAIVASSGRTELLQLQDLTSGLLDAERLSFTLRFGSDGNMDSRAVSDVERLGAMIRNGEFSSRQILVLGFSDNLGTVNAQLNNTQEMAQTVRDAIVTATGRANLGNVRISPIGYGRLLPLGCNDTAIGQNTNNRVEIWVK